MDMTVEPITTAMRLPINGDDGSHYLKLHRMAPELPSFTPYGMTTIVVLMMRITHWAKLMMIRMCWLIKDIIMDHLAVVAMVDGSKHLL